MEEMIIAVKAKLRAWCEALEREELMRRRRDAAMRRLAGKD